jgi:predicted RNase H-like nuclease
MPTPFSASLFSCQRLLALRRNPKDTLSFCGIELFSWVTYVFELLTQPLFFLGLAFLSQFKYMTFKNSHSFSFTA